MSHLDRALFKRRIDREQYGFLTDGDTQMLAEDESCRLEQLLVRCGSCRFVCSAQDVAHIVSALELTGDYVRDVSFPARGALPGQTGGPLSRDTRCPNENLHLGVKFLGN
jgi:hypothetical protein